MTNNPVKLSEDGRAWVEVDLGALAHNAAAIGSILPDGCKLMAVVKTDAYGHGAGKVASRLFREGIETFAVATVAEGVRIRECLPEAEILVLGYTPAKDAEFLYTHNLKQLVVDGAHAMALDATGHKINVHIAVDTGMHRFGIESSNFAEIESVFNHKNLKVEGIATHLASSDSLLAGDVEFSNKQLERFFKVVKELKSKGYDVGKTHSQASYGIYNFPDTKCDYVRAGISLYGVMSHDEATIVQPDLRPVLSLRAVIAQVRWISAGESVSYGRLYTTDKPMKLATVCIGYADGIPRHMSGNGGMCIVRGIKTPLVGRICMDILMIDVTAVDDAQPGDIVTLIGRDGDEQVRCEDVAAASGTITNDVLCRLGSRLPRVYIGDEDI